jgi:hypothetical protein
VPFAAGERLLEIDLERSAIADQFAWLDVVLDCG